MENRQEELLKEKLAQVEQELAEKNRELEVEDALERVRAKTMAMHNSSDMLEVIPVLAEQFQLLGFNTHSVNINTSYDNKDWHLWIVNPGYAMHPTQIHIPYFDHPFFNRVIESLEKGFDFNTFVFTKEEKDSYLDHIYTNTVARNASEERKKFTYGAPGFAMSVVYLKNTALTIANYNAEPYTEEQNAILRRFGKVFEQAYIRFLDLQKAEEQAREAQIEAALERVRSKTMAMHNSNDVGETVAAMFAEFVHLGIHTNRCGILIFSDEHSAEVWTARSTGEDKAKLIIGKLDFGMHQMLSSVGKAWKAKEAFYQYELANDDLIQYYTAINNAKFYPTQFDLNALPSKEFHSDFFFRDGAVFSFTNEPVAEEYANIIKRFAGVFGQTYRRYLDLKKAEAQAREAEIQLALERVRAKTMAMQKQSDLLGVLDLLMEQLIKLGVQLDVANFSDGIPDGDWNLWISAPTNEGTYTDYIHFPRIDHPYFNCVQRALEMYKAGSADFSKEVFTKKEKDSWQDYIFTQTKYKDVLDEEGMQYIYDKPGYTWSAVFLKDTWVSICRFSTTLFSDEEDALLRRFANAFGLAYTRFIDLKKAEAQAREAEIELGLERVRARAMAMQKSDELSDLVDTVFKELTKLDFALKWCIINIIDEPSLKNTVWAANPDIDKAPESYHMKFEDYPFHHAMMKGYKERSPKYVYVLEGQEKKIYDEYLFNETEFKKVPADAQAASRAMERYVVTFSFSNFGGLQTVGDTPLTEQSLDILSRFGKVFDLTYTRFNDLKLAEAQSRESQIQLALERVRARTMAMQKSVELQETTLVLFQQFKSLGATTAQVSLCVFDEDAKMGEMFVTLNGKKIERSFPMELDKEVFVMKEAKRFFLDKQKTFSQTITGKKLQDYNCWRNLLIGKKGWDESDAVQKQSWYVSAVFFSRGMMGISSDKPPSEEAIKLLERFANVFDLTFTRFLDLQKAEAQTREAQVEVALEKVRSRSLAMHKSDELKEAGELLWHELGKLGIESLSSGYVLMEKEEKIGWFYAPNPATGKIAKPLGLYHTETKEMLKVLSCWKKQEPLSVVEMNEEETIAHQTYVAENGLQTDGTKSNWITAEQLIALSPERLFLHNFNFKQGYLMIVGGNRLTDEQIELMLRFTKVFQQTYTRFLDLQKAEAQAREGQIQLALERVRARTMAMQKSDELADVATVLFQQVKALGVSQWACGFCIWDIGDTECMWYSGSAVGEILAPARFPLTEHPVFRIMDESRKRGDELYILEKEGELQADHYRYMMTLPGVRELLQGMLDAGLTFPTFQIDHYANFAYGNLIFITYEHFPEMHDIFKRFAKVFEQTYTRFLDLQKAEAQAREAQIEAGLERVRARTMAMHTSDDVGTATATMFTELEKLGIENLRCGITIIHKNKTQEVWSVSNIMSDVNGVSVEKKNVLAAGTFDMNAHPLWNLIYEKWNEKEDFVQYSLAGKDKENYFKILNTTKDYLPQSIEQFPDTSFQVYFFSEGAVWSASLQPHPDEHKQIMKRFTSVFSLTFRRYQDLQKAETQAREAQIEAALEKVRSRSLAMHKSDELQEVVQTVFEKFKELHVDFYTVIIIIFRKGSKDIVWWMQNIFNQQYPKILIRYDDNIYLRELFEAKETGKELMSNCYTGEEKKRFYSYLLQQTELERVPEHQKKFLMESEYASISVAIEKNTGLHITNYSSKLFSQYENETLKRFAKVFEQAYTRFLDLQKAEAQAREAQIEAALERVRASTMAMHKSEDLPQTAAVLFEQLRILGNTPDRISIGIIHETKGIADMWLTDQSGNEVDDRFILDLNEKTTIRKLLKGWKAGIKSMIVDLTGDELETWLKYVRKIGLVVKDEHFKNRRVHNVAFFSHGWLNISTLEPLSADMINILERFATVYSLTYRRFLDLQKAEASAREAQIEAALERVRAKAMAMQNSNDLSIATSMVFTELRKLGINPIRSGVGLLNNETLKAQLYSATSSNDGDSLSLIGWVMLSGHPVLEKIYDAWLKHEDIFPELSGEQLKLYYEHLLKGFSVDVPDWQNGEKQFGHFFSFSVGCLYAWSETRYDDSQIKILKRFASIIDLTFRRYIELQKSEANAREAVKQAALDRIRADIASMRTISDLDRITPLIWNELTILGVSFIRCGVFIMDKAQQLIHTFLSTPDGKAIAAFHLPFTTPGKFAIMLNQWLEKNIYIDHWTAADFDNIAEILVSEGAIATKDQYINTLPQQGFYLHFLPFLQGMLYVGNLEKLNEEQIELIQHVAEAFSTAYARYEDFNKLEAAKQQVEKTLSDLKQAQQQLVQSEKMASLGELTAGIAHEIQNPLNFVNNFSEVNKEILEELKAERLKSRSERDEQLEEDLINDVIENEGKINHHGKRADAIVKSMLQHSRQTKSAKEPTDINKLADEYLRLAYHGLRAKDKDFNADLKTDFDASIGKINIIPQDIGRVLLNLYNNAFYAVNEKTKLRSASGGYEPRVIVQTKRTNNKVEIKVSDNGNGIPQNIVDKIFQPFFTTKPTGEGTGLGLSLSYDIIKAHGGEIKIETKEGTNFIIMLPA